MTAGPVPASSERRRIQALTRSASDTKALAAAVAPALRPGDVLLVVGDLGAGKTTFVQGLAAGLGITEAVTSPTFTLVRPYDCAGGGVVRTLLHADLYRVERLREVTELALGELVEEDAVAAVEWGDVGSPVLGADAIVVRLAVDDLGDEQTRLVTVELPASSDARVSDLASRLASWAPARS